MQMTQTIVVAQMPQARSLVGPVKFRSHFGYKRTMKQPAPSTQRHPLPLGKLLLAAGLITRPQLKQAIRAQVFSGEGLGMALVRMGVLKAKDAAGSIMVHEQISLAFGWSGTGIAAANHSALQECLNLGGLLQARGELLRQDLDEALLTQAGTAHKLGDVLLGKGLLNGHQLADALNLQDRLQKALLPIHLGLPTAETSVKPMVAAEMSAPEKKSLAAVKGLAESRSRIPNPISVHSDGYGGVAL